MEPDNTLELQIGFFVLLILSIILGYVVSAPVFAFAGMIFLICIFIIDDETQLGGKIYGRRE